MLVHAETRVGRPDGKRAVRCKLAIFAVATGILLVLQYPIEAFDVSVQWAIALTVLLVHAVVMLADALCELFDGKRPRWAESGLGYLLPVRPRGFSQLVTLVGLIAAMIVAMQIRSCAGGGPEELPGP